MRQPHPDQYTESRRDEGKNKNPAERDRDSENCSSTKRQVGKVSEKIECHVYS